jgi:hypothetical protein
MNGLPNRYWVIVGDRGPTRATPRPTIPIGLGEEVQTYLRKKYPKKMMTVLELNHENQYGIRDG